MTTSHAIIAVVLMMAALAAFPKCVTNDKWGGADKAKHVAVGAGLGAAATIAFGDVEYAFVAASLIGVAKEVYDSRGKGTCSLQDAVVTAAGAAAGAYGSFLVLAPNYVGILIRF